MKANLAQRQEIFKELEYKPSPEQEKIHFADLVEDLMIKQVVGGEQAGKSYTASKEIMSRIIEGPLFWLAGEDYEQARPEFEYCFKDAQKLNLLVDYSYPKEGACVMTLLGGGKVKTKSLKDLIKIGQESPNGIVICEAAQTRWKSVERCRTRVAASHGWLMLVGTMEGSLSYYAEKAKEWQTVNPEKARSFSLPSWSNKYNYPGGYDDPRIQFYKRTLPDDVFLERFAGEPCPISDLVVKEFRNEIHVGDYPFKIDLPAELAVDPGYGGAYAVEVVQWLGEAGYVVDEVYLQGYITEEIIQVVQTKPWFKNVQGGAIDIAAKQHQAMPAPIEVWQKLTRLPLKAQKVEEEGGIERLRSFLKVDPIVGKPKLFINQTCKGIISEMGGGRSPVPGGGAWLRDKNTNRPLKKNNHAAKALIYLLVNNYGYITVETAPVGSTNYSPFRGP